MGDFKVQVGSENSRKVKDLNLMKHSSNGFVEIRATGRPVNWLVLRSSPYLTLGRDTC